MKITRLYVYPIKALRGIAVPGSDLSPQGLRHDRRFMLFRVQPDGTSLKKMQLSEVPECALFEQKIVHFPDGTNPVVLVRFHRPPGQPAPADEKPEARVIEVPLEPGMEGLESVEVDLHGSSARVYKMGAQYDRWFSNNFGFDVVLVYIGDGRRPVLGSTLPPKPQRGWLSGVTSYLRGGGQQEEDKTWLTFTDVAPLMVTTEASLRNVQSRMSDSPEAVVDMHKFRPNIVVDGGEEWDEDFWAELTVHGQLGKLRLLLTGNCLRCTSLNVDYETGRPAAGEAGSVLKKLMKDRRVDKGNKWSPVFGRYAFLAPREDKEGRVVVRVGDEVQVTKRLAERTTWDWPDL